MKYKPLIYCQCQKISCETLRYLKYFIILFWKTCHVRYTLTLQRKIYVTRAWSWQFFPMMLYFLSYCSSQNCTQGQVKRKKSLSTYKDSLLERKLDACNNWTIVKLYYVSHIDSQTHFIFINLVGIIIIFINNGSKQVISKKNSILKQFFHTFIAVILRILRYIWNRNTLYYSVSTKSIICTDFLYAGPEVHLWAFV